METPEQFEGWAIVELFGHQREIGYVTTRYFGTAGREIVILEVPAQKALAAAAPGIPVPPVCDDCGSRHDPNADCSDYDPDLEIPI